MTLARWNPFREIDGVFNPYYTGLLTKPSDDTSSEWSPLADITETKDAFHVKAELPGVKKEDVDVSLSNGVLTLKGERKTEEETKDEKQHRIERFHGTFVRRFDLPDNIDQSAITANYVDGVLDLMIPKTTKKSPETLKVDIH
ncbi:MAG: Hsp20/alpha crystallin family protein [Gammaproteobacteria bacterium]|nr:Hsp20/alpha crystallin family protein [Gammaproteobacteria bacterium]